MSKPEEKIERPTIRVSVPEQVIASAVKKLTELRRTGGEQSALEGAIGVTKTLREAVEASEKLSQRDFAIRINTRC